MTEVLTGMRSALSYPERSERPDPRMLNVEDPATPGEGPDDYVYFQSLAKELRITFDAPPDTIVNGVVYKAKSKQLQFHDHLVKCHRVRDKELIETARASRLFGLSQGKEFWDPADYEKALRRQKAMEMLDVLRDPEMVHALRAEVGSDDFAIVERLMDALSAPPEEQKPAPVNLQK